jgi:hypothetical protein
MEAILIGRSRMSAKVALLKPLSSAVSIGTGGPFGAEGPINHDRGSAGLAVRAGVPFVQRRAQDPAGGGCRGRHGGDLRHPTRGGAARGGAAAVRVEATELHPGRGGRGGGRRTPHAAPRRRTDLPPSRPMGRSAGRSSRSASRSAWARASGPGASPGWSTPARTALPGCRSTRCGGR